MKANLLATKLHRPSLPAQWVERPYLTQRLAEGLGLNRQLTLVSAPAGFGKTTCICEWLNTLDDWPVTWLSLDAADDDPGRFFTYLVAALQKIEPNLGQTIASILHSGQLPPGDVVSATLINDILAVNGRFLLVLDDFHVIRDSLILQVVEDIVTNFPPSLHLVLITREDPPLPLARLRANNRLTEIRARDLRFTDPDVDRFFNEVMDIALSQADTVALKEKTEGWIVGLQLAAIAMQSRLARPEHRDVTTFVQEFTGSHLYVAEYLLEEVLKQQPEEVQTFLRHTAILDRLSAGLCDAVTNRQDGRAMLTTLHRANLFVMPLDAEGQWYRYHHLFADLLRARLPQRLSKEKVNELHLRAALWYEQNGFISDAIKHGLVAQAEEKVAALVEQEARAMMFSGQANTLRSWLTALPEATFQTHPRLNIYRLWIDLMQEKLDLSAQALRQKEAMLHTLPPTPENEQLRVELTAVLCRFVAFSGDTTRAIRLADEALASLPKSETALRARAHSALAVAHWIEGNRENARQAYDQCMTLAQASDNYTLAAHATMMLAMSQTDYGQLHQAARTYQSIIEMGEQAKQKLFFPAGQGYIGLAGIHQEWNELETAASYLEQGMDLCRRGGLAGLSAGYALRARLRQAQGDLLAAAAELDSLGQTGVDPTGMARRILLSIAMGDLDEAARRARPWLGVLNAEPASGSPPLLIAEIIKVTLARLFFAQGDLAHARHLLNEVAATAVPDQRYGRLIEVYLLQALIHQAQNEGKMTTAAIEAFRQALELAQPEGYVLLFLEAGTAVIPLLQAVIKQRETPAPLKAYAQQLLDACHEHGQSGSPSPPGAAAELVENLTPREMEVLQLVAAGDSNQAIADKLVITVRTVKKHITNILGKLSVDNRTQAAARARELGLITSD